MKKMAMKKKEKISYMNWRKKVKKEKREGVRKKRKKGERETIKKAGRGRGRVGARKERR